MISVRRTLSDEAHALWADGAGRALVVLATGWGLLVGSRMVYPVLLPHLRDSFALSLPQAGLLVSVLWLCAAIGQLPSGMLADAIPERTVMAASVLAVALSLGAVVLAPSVRVLFVATALWGLSHSLYPIARITILAKIYRGRLGSALGVTMATGDVGQTILPPVAITLAGVFAWQVGLGFVIPLLVVLGVALYIVLPRTETNGDGGDASSPPFRAVLVELKRPGMAMMSAMLFLYIFLWQSFTAFYPTYLISIKGFSGATAGLLFGLFFAVGIVMKPIAGAAYDRVGMRWSLISVLLPALGGFALLPLIDHLWGLIILTAMISVMLGSGAITQSYLAHSFSESMRGTGLGVIRTGTATLGAAGPFVFGVIAGAGYFDEGYLLLALIMAAVILLVTRIPER